MMMQQQSKQQLKRNGQQQSQGNINSKKKLWEVSDYLSEFIKCMHIQQHTTLRRPSQPQHSRFYQLMHLTHIQSLTINLLTQQLNLSVNSLTQHIHQQPQYFEQSQYIISRQLRKVGEMSKQLAKLINFTSQQERLLAEYQTMKFLQLFNVSNQAQRRGYFGRSQQQYNLLFVNFIKSIYPRVNVHKDNLPLYMPFYSSIKSYEEDTPVGNPNWELARMVLRQVYAQEMVGVLDEETREEEQVKGNNDENNHNTINKRDIWFKLLICDPEYLKRHQQQQQQQTSLQRIWSLMHFYYVQQTLKPYRTMSTDKNMVNSECSQEEISINSIIQALKNIIKEQPEKTMKLLYSVMLYQLTQSDWDLANIINLLKSMFEEGLSKRMNEKGAITEDISEENNNRELNFIALLNAECCQLVRNLTEIQSQKQMKDEHRIIVLTQLLKQAIDIIHFTVTNRLPYHSHYLRIAYPSHTVDLNQRLDNEQKIFNTLLEQMLKDNQINTMVYSFPEYPYFEKGFYEQFSQVYLAKHPGRIIQIADFLPVEVAVWGLMNSPGLEVSGQFKRIRSVLFKNQQPFLQCIKQRVPEITSNIYINFIQAWDRFHQLIDEGQQYQHDARTFMQKLDSNKITVNYICNLKLPQLFRKHTYFVLDNSENILKMLVRIVEGLDDILLTVDLNTQEKIIDEYLQFLGGKNFKTILLAKLTEDQRDGVWRKWVTVLMADESLVRELVGGGEQQEEEKIVEREEKVIEEKIIIKNKKQPKKPSTEANFMDLQD